MFGNLSEALRGLTRELFEHRKLKMAEFELLKCGLATKRDLMEAKHEIIKVMGEHVAPETLKQLGNTLAAHVAPLKKALEDAPTISG